jgi:CopG family transcriptional regulator, nickel-responsive regulator
VSELVRFGVAIDEELLARFDERIGKKGYQNRSEAIRDLVRADLVEAAALSNAHVHAALTLVYDHHVRELTERLTEIQHELGGAVVSTMHVHIDHDLCLEVIVMRGAAARLQAAAEQMVALKGVRNGRLTVAAGADDANPPDSHEHSHGDSHRHTHTRGRNTHGR